MFKQWKGRASHTIGTLQTLETSGKTSRSSDYNQTSASFTFSFIIADQYLRFSVVWSHRLVKCLERHPAACSQSEICDTRHRLENKMSSFYFRVIAYLSYLWMSSPDVGPIHNHTCSVFVRHSLHPDVFEVSSIGCTLFTKTVLIRSYRELLNAESRLCGRAICSRKRRSYLFPGSMLNALQSDVQLSVKWHIRMSGRDSHCEIKSKMELCKVRMRTADGGQNKQ